jgi:hypothetical protein
VFEWQLSRRLSRRSGRLSRRTLHSGRNSVFELTLWNLVVR